ncbi:sporulation membrane protein YtaF [Insulibacter thermoxylanivorax]|uniref:Sporulation membrane protein YtaF n=1 Tax=Insulibacter thermoxylanivorax TaxID=2749268 RepID=A0A916QC70_9BACL|nr:MntP/YtaF family protein [Insulibacter thermoxylanivorax]GFR38065.1 sporulation membrane protein YtaF [Insulibacter thermoxylanivorax]
MLPYVSIILLACAVSLDSFGVGLNYGMRQIKIPGASILIIGCCSGLMILLSMLLGGLLIPYIPERYAGWIGGMILICIGLWAFVQIWRQRRCQGNDRDDNLAFEDGELPECSTESAELSLPESLEPRKVLHLELRRLGIVIEILRTPSSADRDRSGTISPGEAALLGTALSLDAFGAGIGAVFIGLSPWLTASVIAVFSSVFLRLGIDTGNLASHIAWLGRLTFLPGIILIVLGLSKLLQ